MGDVMELARVRQSELEADIAAREAEIAEMRNEIETLSRFIEIGTELMGHATDKSAEPAQASRPAPDVAASKDDDLDFEDDFDPFDDEEDLGASIAQLHGDRPRSRPISRPA